MRADAAAEKTAASERMSSTAMADMEAELGLSQVRKRDRRRKAMEEAAEDSLTAIAASRVSEAAATSEGKDTVATGGVGLSAEDKAELEKLRAVADASAAGVDDEADVGDGNGSNAMAAKVKVKGILSNFAFRRLLSRLRVPPDAFAGIDDELLLPVLVAAAKAAKKSRWDPFGRHKEAVGTVEEEQRLYGQALEAEESSS
eukprot:GHVU01067341.1.p1 GENE.GHVU01067341.1~~GHVU01067341.1.p1  ORF type:complete len:224 (+),score=61.65 GHVU01067341.1:71-673(+)